MILDWGILKDTLICMAGLSSGWLVSYFIRKRNVSKVKNKQKKDKANFSWVERQSKAICLECLRKDNCYIFNKFPYDSLFFLERCDGYKNKQ